MPRARSIRSRWRRGNRPRINNRRCCRTQMEIQKTYDGVHFSVSTLRNAFLKLVRFVPKKYSTFESCDVTADHADGTRHKFKSPGQFFESDAELTLREFYYYRGSDYGLTVHLGSNYSTVSVRAVSQEEIDGI